MARSGRSFDNAFLERLRGIALLDALSRLNLYWKFDPDFQPVRNANTRRLYVSVGSNVVELLLTGQKWYDPRVGIGGGGCIDLAMHLLGISFVDAVNVLSSHSIEGRNR